MKRMLILIPLLAAVTFLPQAGRGAELITNGGFETANFTGWTATNASGFWMSWAVVSAGFDSGGFFPPTAPPVGLREAYQGTASTANSPFTLDQTFTIPPGATASISWRHRLRVDLSSFCTTLANCGTVVYSVQILNTSNTVLQTLYTRTAPGLSMTDTGWQFNLRSLNAYAGQTIKVRFTTTASVTFAGPGQMEIDAVSVQTPAIVTAANASIGGRLTTSNGAPVRGGVVTLTGGNGDTRTAISNPFGYYVFTEVPTGFTYIIGTTSKQYFFPDSPVAINLSGDLTDLNFQASP